MRTHAQQTIWASLDEIRIGERTVARLSAPTVELYRVWFEQGRDAPPVRLARHGDAFVVRDGRHRVAAALAAGHTVIEAEVRPIGRIRRLVTAWIHRGRVSGPSRLDLTRGCALGAPVACTEQDVGSIPTVSMQFRPPWCQRQACAFCMDAVRVQLLPEALERP